MITGFCTFSNGESQRDEHSFIKNDDFTQLRDFYTLFTDQCFNYAIAHDMTIVSLIFVHDTGIE